MQDVINIYETGVITATVQENVHSCEPRHRNDLHLANKAKESSTVPKEKPFHPTHYPYFIKYSLYNNIPKKL